jgi:hypothetical protein
LNLLELKQEKDWRSYKRQEQRWMEETLRVRHPERGSIPFILRDAQSQTLDVWTSNRLSITLKARQVGFSTLVAAHVLHQALFFPDRFIILLSRGEREAAKLLEKASYAYDRLPEWMRERVKRTNKAEGKMTFANGSIIESLPASAPARGDAASLIVVDEWAFFEDPEGAWASIEPAADIGGKIIALSTANGWGNLFHQMWVGATTGNSKFAPIFFGWDAVPDRDEDWYAAKADEMPAHILHQEYPRDPDEAFIKSGNPVFDPDILKRLEQRPPLARGRLTHNNDRALRSFYWREENQGPLRLWAYPQAHHNYVIGADVADGNEHGDYSAAHVIDLHSHEVVAVWHGHIDSDLFGLELAKLGWWFNNALVAPEANNRGIATIKSLQRIPYGNIFRHRLLGNRKEPKADRLGWQTTKATKPLMIDELNGALREGSVSVYDPQTVTELKTYVRDEKGQTHGSPYDDRVVSLAICWQMTKWAGANEYREKKDDTWTVDWWARQIPTTHRRTDFTIGAESSRDGAALTPDGPSRSVSW